ncbi:MAG: flagellar biosynthesis anti-sigma factor FlgM [Leptospira sp.]|nr:flagellar biosynthesis anti-sigma factor FlgM [Leptospira sp.]
MTIDKIGGLGPQYEPRKSNPVKKSEPTEAKDNIFISDVARQKATEVKLQAEIKGIVGNLKSGGDDQERIEKLKEVKAKLKNGDYDNLSQEVLNKIADNISETLLG